MSDPIRAFRKFNPRQILFLSNGTSLKFTEVEHNWGILATNNQFVISELETMMREKRGGISEISGEEYHEMRKKKAAREKIEGPILRRPWREELAKGQPKAIPSPPANLAQPAEAQAVREIGAGDLAALRPQAGKKSE